MSSTASLKCAPPRLFGFADVVKERTKSIHREAERSGIIADIVRGRATLRGYAVFLSNFVPVYAALERRLAANAGAPVVGVFADASLRRLGVLESDLSSIVRSAADLAPLPRLPEADRYAAAIEDAGERSGWRLAAHAYARYLGDLSGGQILKPVLARNLGLEPPALSFYDFPDIPDIEAKKTNIRAALDSIAVDSPEADEFVADAVAAFRHNIDMSEAVARFMAEETQRNLKGGDA